MQYRLSYNDIQHKENDMGKSEVIGIRFSKKELDVLRELADEQGRSIANLIRFILRGIIKDRA